MSAPLIRSLRSPAVVRATTSRAVNPVRRYASAHGEHKQTSDMPWVLGSAAIFLPLGAYVVNDLRKFKSGGGHGHGDAHGHDEHSSHDEKHVEHAEDAHTEESKEPVNEVEGSHDSEEASAEQAIAADGDPAEAKAVEEANSSAPSSFSGSGSSSSEAKIALDGPMSSLNAQGAAPRGVAGPEGHVPEPDAHRVGKSGQPSGPDAPAAKTPASASAERLKEAEEKDRGGNDPKKGSDPTTKEGSRDKIQLATYAANQKELKERVQADAKPRSGKDESDE